MKTQNLKSVLKTLTLASLTAGLAACGENAAPVKHRIDINSLSAHAMPETAAENLALAGEQLMSANSLVYADRVFDAALEKNRENARALFYKKALAPVMALKGIATRARPVLTTAKRADLDSALHRLPESGAKTYLTVGAPDIQSEKDAQAVIDDVIKGMNDFREYLKTSKGEEITINAPEYLHAKTLERASRTCAAQEISNGVFELANCDLTQAYRVTLNRADKEALQQIVAGYQAYFSLLNAYRMDGAIELTRIRRKHDVKPSFVQSFLLSQPEWGALRDPQLLNSVLDMGADATKGIRWIQANQARLCPSGIEQDRSRVGALFHKGLCVRNDSATNHSIAIAETLLGGGTTGILAESGKTVQTRPSALLSNPIRNLKSQLPIKKDACNRLVYAPDATIGGYLPNGDLNELFQNKCANEM